MYNMNEHIRNMRIEEELKAMATRVLEVIKEEKKEEVRIITADEKEIIVAIRKVK